MEKAHLILIAGGTCSGKTTIAREIGKQLARSSLTIFSHDQYYRDLSHLPKKEQDEVNFDHPDALDYELLISDVKHLVDKKKVVLPDYDFISHKRVPGSVVIDGTDIIILEGIFSLYYPELVQLANLKVFVDTDADIRLARRIRRDIRERGFTIDSVLRQYMDTVKPMHEIFIEPTKKNADIIVPGGKKFDKVLTMMKGYLSHELINF
ncbi:MAG TPA: uridine kinase [Candidatus Cloacimonadota bacterium]|nr:uridine kinase [Candidatus Cloacimonadota bacterium]HPT72540.1 uridine kinase [Candidatus Cloacimonadota bacterium]